MARKTTLAMVQTDRRKLEPRDLPIPEIADDSALLRIEACGICGSDYEPFEGTLPVAYPLIPGHEPLGVIEQIGDRAAQRWGVNVVDRVDVETMLPCHHCRSCLVGKYQLCRGRGRLRMYSYIPLSEPPGLWGAYAEYMYLAPGSIVHKLDPTLPAELAVLFNPLGAGFRWAVEIPETQPGDTVVVLGPGQRGLTSVLACREVGAGTIIVTGLEADVVVEVSSYATAPVAAALDYVRSGGTIVLAGIKGFKPVPDFVSDRGTIESYRPRHATL